MPITCTLGFLSAGDKAHCTDLTYIRVDHVTVYTFPGNYAVRGYQQTKKVNK
mgnify:CR=1 FL=1